MLPLNNNNSNTNDILTEKINKERREPGLNLLKFLNEYLFPESNNITTHVVIVMCKRIPKPFNCRQWLAIL